MTNASNKILPVSVEVSAEEVLGGTTEINGTVTYTDEVIEFAYYTKFLVREDEEEQHLRIPVDRIREVKYKSSVISAKVILLPKRLDIMKEMPGASRDKIVFHIKREDRSDAEVFVSFLKHRLYQLGETGMESIPFQLEDTNMGLTEHRGLLYLDDEFLVFEIQSGLSGMSKGERQTIKIEPAALASVRFNQGGIKDTIYIRPKKEALLRAIPGDYETEVKLKIAKRNRQAAERFVNHLQHRVQAS